jgi:hypothetical protein
MVCLGNICINTLQKGAKNDDDDDDDDNNNNKITEYHDMEDLGVRSTELRHPVVWSFYP